MPKIIFYLFLGGFIVISFALAPSLYAAPCPSDVVSGGTGICGVADAVKESDGWCCRTVAEQNSGNFDCLSGYCGSPDGPGGKYSDYKCCKPKTTTTGSPEGTTPTPPAVGPSGSSGGAGAGGGTSVSLAEISPVQIDATPEGVAGFIGQLIDAVLGVVGAFALFMFVYGGIMLLSSAGNDSKIKKGKDVITWSVIGIAVILSSYVLVNFIITGITGTAGTGTSGGGAATDPDHECKIINGQCTIISADDLDCTKQENQTACINAFVTANSATISQCVAGKCSGGFNRVCCNLKSP